MSHDADLSLQAFYDSLWQTAEDAFTRQAVRIDPHLDHQDDDPRRGLSLILRPGGEAVRSFQAFVEELRQIEPHQYFYEPRDYHVTILSPLTATVDYQCPPERIEAYAQAIVRAKARHAPFQIRFRGITATPEAVMLQGFPDDDAINRLRGSLREEMAAAQLPIQQRYPPRAAHMTLMRFSKPCRNFPALLDHLRAARARDFSSIHVDKIELVENNWYMTRDKVRPLGTFGLTK